MSILIAIDLQIHQESEPEGYGFGYHTFDSLTAIGVVNVETTQDMPLSVIGTDASNNDHWKLPISNDILLKLQQEDMFCKNILEQIEKGNIIEEQLYVVKGKLLK